MKKIFRNWDILLLLIIFCLGIIFWWGRKEEKEIIPSIKRDETSLARDVLNRYATEACKEIDKKDKEIDEKTRDAEERFGLSPL